MAHRPARSRQSRRAARLDFAGLEIIGALLTPDIVARLAAFEANDQSEESYEIPAGLKLRDEIARYYRIAEALWARFGASLLRPLSGSSSIFCASAWASIQSNHNRSRGSANVNFRSDTWPAVDVCRSSSPQRRSTEHGVPAWMKVFLSSGTALAGGPRPCSCRST